MADQIKYTQKLKGSKVLVIGGSSGIGFGVAEACLENGCDVTISSSNASRISSTITKLQTSYPSLASNIRGQVCDLSDQTQLDTNIHSLFEQVGSGIDHVIFTAGDALALMPISEIDLEKVHKAGTVRFFAPLFVAKHAPKYMSAGPASSIILTTGSVSQKPREKWSVVGAFATGLQGLTRGLALDLKPVRVNLVSPGGVDTELWDGLGLSEERKRDMLQKMGSEVPVGKVGSVHDLAECYLYLMKDRNVTGTMISSNGGSLLV